MRTIRLKETRPGADDFLTPSDSYRALCDHTLELGPFRRRADADGFLLTGAGRPDATQNLILLGDSLLEGNYVHEQHRFASLMEAHLPAEWRVLNGGYSGTSSLHLLSQIGVKLPPLMTKDSAVVVFIGQADAEVLFQPGTYWDSKERVTPILPGREGSAAPWSAQEASLRVVRAIIEIGSAFGFKLGVVASPFRDGDFSCDPVLRALYRRDRGAYVTRTTLRRQIQENARQVATETGVPFLDGQALVEPTHFYDLMHLNRDGHSVFSEVMLDWVKTWAIASG